MLCSTINSALFCSYPNCYTLHPLQETLEGIQESEGPLPQEDLEGEGREAEGEAGEDAPSSLPWKRGGEGAAVPAGFGAEIPRYP